MDRVLSDEEIDRLIQQLGLASLSPGEVAREVESAILSKLADRLEDSARLDHIQQTGSTVSLFPDGYDQHGALSHSFCVGGLLRAVNRDIRAAIDAARKGKA